MKLLEFQQTKESSNVLYSKETAYTLRVTYVDKKDEGCNCGCGGSSSLRQYHKKTTTDNQFVDQSPQQSTMTKGQQSTAKLQNIVYREKFRNERKAEKALSRYDAILKNDIKLASQHTSMRSARNGGISHKEASNLQKRWKYERDSKLRALGLLRKEKLAQILKASEIDSQSPKTQRVLEDMNGLCVD